VIQHPWARASIGQARAGAAYLTIVNRGQSADRLIAIATPAAKHAKLHTHLLEEGVMKMRPVEAIEIAPGEPAVLEPGGLHIMLMGLTAPLEAGEPFPMTLIFENAGTVDVEVTVTDPFQMEEAEPGEMEHAPDS
jgi:copper(I)-binding protein